MDEKRNLAVRTMFKKMYDDKLIYRGHRIVNWDPKGQTTIADDEIVYEERKSKNVYV
jgi:valyl-tRNA synthetase